MLRGSQNTEKRRESVFPLIFHSKLFLKREKNRAVPSLTKKCVLAVLTIYKIYLIEIILTLTHHAQRHLCTINKIIMSTSLLGFSWPEKLTAEFSEESQTLVYVDSSEP